MFVLSNFVSAVASILDVVLTIYMWIVIIAALISWVNPDPYNPIVRFLYRATEPVFYRIRRITGVAGGIDFSPMIVILIILFIKYFVIASLRELAFRIR
ncbi:MAG: YggT family protein [Nitrospiraceae bacterium]|nr:YggT family protein [Nitrospiraceae bacterium]MDA8389029.1 YggT family protein [Nitrospiraceae bacterium]